MTKNIQYKNDLNFVCLIVIGTIPASVLGVLLSDFIADNVSMTMIALMLFVTGIALWLIRNIRGVKNDGDLAIKEVIIVGFGQAVALVPGIIRSGATIISSVAVGMKQEIALRYSLMLYIPVSLGGVVLGYTNFLSEPNKASLAIPYTAAFVCDVIDDLFCHEMVYGHYEKW